MENLDNLGYSTHVLGTIKSVTECKKILVYNSNSFIEYPRLSLYNLLESYNNYLRESDLCYTIERTNIDSPFIYWTEGKDGFNIIIYLENDIPVGFTEFINLQGLISDRIDIFLDFKIEGIQVNIIFNNSFKSNLEKEFIGEELNEYVSRDKVKIKTTYSQYSNHISSGSSILLGQGVINKERVLGKLNLRNYNYGEDIFSNFQVSFYDGEITLYMWGYLNSEIHYKIVSLETGNQFSNNSDGYIHTVYRTSKEVLYFSGRYMILNNFTIYDTLLGSLLDIDNSYNYFIDSFDITGKIRKILKTGNTYKKTIETVPELINTFYDFNNSIEGKVIIRKIGDWFIIKENLGYILTNMYKEYFIDDYKDLIIINDNSFLIKYSDRYSFNGEKDISLTDKVYNTPLNYYRKNTLSNYNIPDIVTAFKGLIFCKDNNKNIYCL